MTVLKYFLAINNTISVASNRGTVLLKISKTKWIMPSEIVLYIFGKDEPPTIKKLLVEEDIPEWLLKRALKKKATEHDWEIGYWALITFYFLLRIGEYSITSDKNQTQLF